MVAVPWLAGDKITAANLVLMEGVRTAVFPTSVSNSVAETAIAVATIPANDAVAGVCYRVVAWGIASVVAATTPTINFKVRMGGITGSASGQSGARTASAGITNHTWKVESLLSIFTDGASGTTGRQTTFTEAISVAGGAPYVSPAVIMDGTVDGTINTTIDNDYLVSVQWGTAATGNIATCKGAIFERVA
jgi:hypothetical protein